MSFLAGRLAATEGAYFLQESKEAVGRIARRLPAAADANQPPQAMEGKADVLPEILRHSIPLRLGSADANDPSFSVSKWLLKPSWNSSGVSSRDAINPLRAYASIPQATFGRKRWQLPNEQPTFAASTANELRRDRYSHSPDPEKVKAMAAGFSMVAKAFAIATTLVFGGATAAFYQLQLHTVDDIKGKAKDLIQPGANIVKEQIGPLRAWAESTSRKWHVESNDSTRQKQIVKQLSKVLGTGAKSSD